MQINRVNNSLTKVTFLSGFSADIIEREPQTWYYVVFDTDGKEYLNSLDDNCKTFKKERDTLDALRTFMTNKDLL